MNPKRSKVDTIEHYRKGFSDGVKKNEEGKKLFAENIGSVIASILGTPFEDASYSV